MTSPFAFPESPSWTLDEKRWIRAKWEQIREAQAKADTSNNRWKRINSEVNDYLNRSNIHDDLQRAKIKGESLALKDALATGNWHSRNAERHIADVRLYLKLKEMGLL